MAEIAAEAGLPAGRVHQAFPTKSAILTGISRQADAAVLAEPIVESGQETPRDRLFDVIMRRFDALAPYKTGIAAISREVPNAGAAVALLCQLTNSMRWMLEAAGIGTAGPRGALQTAGLAALYANVMRTWIADDSVDLARTMSELDRQLRWAEQTMNSLPGAMKRAPEGDQGKERVFDPAI